MENSHRLSRQFTNQNIMSGRGVSILFIIICSLIMANIRCDQVGSANGK